MRLRDVARVFLRVANSTWGSGAATIANIRRELVEERGALTNSDFSLSYALSRVAPGTNVLAYCAAMGWLLRGWPGALVGVTALSVPAAIVTVLLTTLYERWHAYFLGAMAAVVGIICGGAFLLARPYLTRSRLLRTLILLGAALIAGQFLSPVVVLALAGAAGLLWPEQ